MRKLLLQLSIFLAAVSCTPHDGGKELFKEQATKINRLNREVANLVGKTDSLKSVINFYELQVDLLSTPAGKVITYEDENSSWLTDYYFFDEKIIIDFKDHAAHIGTWKIKDDSLQIHITKVAGKRGIGEPINPEGGVPAHHIYDYHEFVPFSEKIDKKISYHWNDFSTELIVKLNTENGYVAGFSGLAPINSAEVLDKYDITLDGNYPFVSERPLNSSELSKYSKLELKIMRNEIFARYGYIFKSQEMKEYFSSQKWYKPAKENVDLYLTDTEKENIELILQHEN